MYALDRKGLNYLLEQGIDVREYFWPFQEKETEQNFLFREHMLSISDILIHARIVCADVHGQIGEGVVDPPRLRAGVIGGDDGEAARLESPDVRRRALGPAYAALV